MNEKHSPNYNILNSEYFDYEKVIKKKIRFDYNFKLTLLQSALIVKMLLDWDANQYSHARITINSPISVNLHLLIITVMLIMMTRRS